MNLYEVEAQRWYFAEIYYRVVAKDQQDAFQLVDKMDKGVVEYSTTGLEYKGDETILYADELQTVHKMYPTDDISRDHTNCQLIGNMWNCGHVDRQYYIGKTEGEQLIQLPLWPRGKAWNEEN